jgi:hypothetical protein
MDCLVSSADRALSSHLRREGTVKGEVSDGSWVREYYARTTAVLELPVIGRVLVSIDDAPAESGPSFWEWFLK